MYIVENLHIGGDMMSRWILLDGHKDSDSMLWVSYCICLAFDLLESQEK